LKTWFPRLEHDDESSCIAGGYAVIRSHSRGNESAFRYPRQHHLILYLSCHWDRKLNDHSYPCAMAIAELRSDMLR
jgi:hypothetical protein